MITPTKIKQIRAKASQFPEYQVEKNDILVFPLILTGFTNNTNAGLFENTSIGLNDDVNRFSFFEKIDEGKQPIFAIWEGAYSGITKKDNCNINGNARQYTTYAEIENKVGLYYHGQFMDESDSADIDETASWSDFKSLQFGETISLRFENQDWSNRNLKNRFYWIEGAGLMVFKVNAIHPHKSADGKRTISYVVDFEYTGNQLAKTGQAFENYIQFASAGMGYAFPKVERVNDEVKVMLDPDKIKHTGITHAQLELLNNSAIGNWSFQALELNETENDDELSKLGTISQATKDPILNKYTYRLYQPKTIFANHFFPTETSTLYRKQYPTQNYSVLPQAHFLLTADYDKWAEQLPNAIKSNTKYSYEGYLKHGNIPTSFDDIISTLDVINNDWNKEKITFGNVSGTFYVSNLVLGNGDDPNTFNFNGKNYSFGEIIAINSYLQSDILSFPTESTVNITSYVRNWPIVGRLFSAVIGGVKLGIRTTENARYYNFNSNKLPLLLGDSYATTFGDSLISGVIDGPKTALEVYKNADANKDTQDVFSLSSSVLHSFLFNFTDLFVFDNGTANMTANTLSLEQTRLYTPTTDGVIHLDDKPSVLKLQNIKEQADTSHKKYIIVALQLQAVSDGICRLTTYNELNYFIKQTPQNNNFTFSFYTNNYWRKSLRNWTTQINLSPIEAFNITGQKIEYPTSNVSNLFSIQYINNIVNGTGGLPKGGGTEVAHEYYVENQHNAEMTLTRKWLWTTMPDAITDWDTFKSNFSGNKIKFNNSSAKASGSFSAGYTTTNWSYLAQDFVNNLEIIAVDNLVLDTPISITPKSSDWEMIAPVIATNSNTTPQYAMEHALLFLVSAINCSFSADEQGLIFHCDITYSLKANYLAGTDSTTPIWKPVEGWISFPNRAYNVGNNEAHIFFSIDGLEIV